MRILIASLLLFFTWGSAFATHANTGRIPLFSNQKVNVWKTIIYPSKTQALKMHRHEYNRVLIALNHGVLKIVNNKGQVHYLKLEKENAYYLQKNKPGHFHMDENISKHPIKVVVIELKP